MKRSRDIWVLVVVFILLVGAGFFLALPSHREEYTVSTTYNADPLGVKAFYTLLGERLGYTVGRLRKPYTEMPGNARLLIVVQPATIGIEMDEDARQLLGDALGISDEERAALQSWVRRGGTVMFLSDNLAGVPATFGSDRRIGKGHVYAFSSREMITNRGMRDPRNAVKLLGIIDRHAGKRDLVLFDEYHHGDKERRPLWSYVSRQVKFAMALLLAAGLVLCHTRGRRFGAVRNLPKSETVRPGYEFVESVGRLYQRAHAADLAARILCASFRQALCARFGMPADSPRDAIARRLASDIGGGLPKRVDAVLADCDRLVAGQKPDEPELLRVATEIVTLEKEMRLGSIGA